MEPLKICWSEKINGETKEVSQVLKKGDFFYSRDGLVFRADDSSMKFKSWKELCLTEKKFEKEKRKMEKEHMKLCLHQFWGMTWYKIPNDRSNSDSYESDGSYDPDDSLWYSDSDDDCFVDNRSSSSSKSISDSSDSDDSSCHSSCSLWFK